MLDMARARAEQAGLQNVSFQQADAQVHRFKPATFNVAISRTGTMFFGDPAAAYANIAAALRPGGRIAFFGSGRTNRRTNGSPPSPAPSALGVTCLPRRPRRRTHSR